MELLYIWFENYQNIFVDQGFNFSSKYRYIYNSKTKFLTIKENYNHIDNFFNLDKLNNKSRIVDVTAIIGENGTGKSTLLDFIKQNLVEGSGGINERSIIILKNKGEKLIYHHPEISIEKTNNIKQDYDFKLKEFKNPYTNSQMQVNLEIDEFKNTSYIFFSNIFDNKKTEEEWGNLRNISTNYLLKKDKKEALENKLVNSRVSEVEIHRLSEIYRQIKFINNFSSEKNTIPFNLPNEIIIKPIQVEVNFKDIPDKDKYQYGGYYNFVSNVKDELYNYTKGISSNIDKLRYNFYNAIFTNFFYEIVSYNTTVTINQNILDIKKLEGNNILEKINSMFNKILFSLNNKNDQTNSNIEWLNGIIELIKFIEQNISSNNSHDKYLKLKIEDNNKLRQLIEIYEKAFKFIPFLNFDWRDLSSGEKALLKLYSRFYSLVDDEVFSNRKLKQNIIILIDEGELYLHPQWQKKLLKNLFDFSRMIYPNRKLQLILTSNSPFIASDLPKSNIVFLKKKIDKSGDEKCIVVDGLDDKKQTFASNIHSLFSDSFFMKDGLLGDFAKYKIDRLIDLLINSNTKKIRKNKKEIKKLINIIGEPVIKNKLLSMLEDKLKIDLIGVDEKIKKLQKQIDELKESNQ